MVLTLPAIASAFPYHCQRHPMGCSLACFRMLEEWVTGTTLGEDAWRKRLEGRWSAGAGFPSELVPDALGAELGSRFSSVEALHDDALHSLPERFVEGAHALLLFVDLWKPRPNGVTNNGHFLLVHGFRRGSVRPLRKDDGATKAVACFHDPAVGPDRLVTWESLITPTPHLALLVERNG